MQGRVFCDNCRAGFETAATKYLKGKAREEEKKDGDSDLSIYLGFCYFILVWFTLYRCEREGGMS